VGEQLTYGEREQLEAVRRERAALQARFATLPTNQQEVEERRQRMQARVDEVDREAFRLGYELQSLRAVTTAVRKWVDDTRAQRQSPPEEEQAFLAELQVQEEALDALQAELERTRARLADERNSADSSVAGEDLIRRQYDEVLGRERALLAAAQGRLPEDAAYMVARIKQVRERTGALRARTTVAKRVLREQLERRGRLIREKVLAEQQLLDTYDTELAQASGDARQLVGRIAYGSIQRVRAQFYELVLKADVGLVDVAFNRKQGKTGEIQKVSSEKDRELRALDAEFKEVLQDVD
jgi:chromosome segregation ATPase